MSETTVNTAESVKRKTSKKLLIIIIAIVLVIAVAIGVLLPILLKKTDNKNVYAFYILDNEIHRTSLLNEPEQEKITQGLYDFEGEKLSALDGFAYTLGDMTHVFNDGIAMIYPKKITERGVELCYSAFKDGAEPVTLDTDVFSYFVSSDEKVIYYFKASDSKDKYTLYQHDLSSKTKIQDNVIEFYSSKDGTRLLYLTEDDTLYFKALNENAKKLSNNVDEFYNLNDVNTVFYLKEGILFKFISGESSRQIANDVYGIISAYDSGEIYYTKRSDNVINVIDYIEKDTDNEALYERLKTAKHSIFSYSLYYYNTDEILVSDMFIYDSLNDTYAKDAPVVAFNAYHPEKAEKVKLSSVNSYIEALTALDDAVSVTRYQDIQLAVKDKVISTDIDYAFNYFFSDDGSTFYYLDEISVGSSLDDTTGTLNKIQINDGAVSDKTKIDEKVFYAHLENGALVYEKNYNGKEFDLYVDSKLVDEGVNAYFIKYTDNKIAYLTDYDNDTNSGTLKLFDGNSSKEIAKNVFDFDFSFNGDVIYLFDYSLEDLKGTLSVYNGEAVKLNENVKLLMHVENKQYHDNTELYYNGR